MRVGIPAASSAHPIDVANARQLGGKDESTWQPTRSLHRPPIAARSASVGVFTMSKRSSSGPKKLSRAPRKRPEEWMGHFSEPGTAQFEPPPPALRGVRVSLPIPEIGLSLSIHARRDGMPRMPADNDGAAHQLIERLSSQSPPAAGLVVASHVWPSA